MARKELMANTEETRECVTRMMRKVLEICKPIIKDYSKED